METFLVWWAIILMIGIGFMPLTAILFKGFKDRGWIFSKILGIAICGFLTWVPVCQGILRFTGMTCLVITLLCIAANFVLFYFQKKSGKGWPTFGKEQLITILIEEVLFFAIFMTWTYIAGFRPAAYGTEKFMDFGFMAAMMRSSKLPAEDLWYSGEAINYYYGGQYYAVFLTKLTQTKVAETYNVMRTMLAAFAFVVPYAIVEQIWSDFSKSKISKIGNKLSIPAGILAGAAVSLAGNMHYVIIGKIWPFLQSIGLMKPGDNSYWFPNSTRYLGHYPAVGDETIHEFPAYSFVLGDLHAHVVNVMYVLLVVGILYAFIKTTKKDDKDEVDYKSELMNPYIIILGFFIGIFQWTNYWDFLIYAVVANLVGIYQIILTNGLKWSKIIKIWLVRVAVLNFVSIIVALPFTILFKEMTTGQGLVGIAFNRSILWQWLIIWGLPLAVMSALIFIVIKGYFNTRKSKAKEVAEKLKYNIFEHVNKQDGFICILGMCAIGLIVMPEVVYVRDIYEASAARANTMFKLTYQAYMMFGMCMVYAIMRFITAKRKELKIFGVVSAICLLATICYIGSAVKGWFGDVFDSSRHQGLDATQFLENEEVFAGDAPAIRWLQDTIKGSPVVLEANGDSYTDYCRVSAMTGLPTIAGWYVHEWLWRSDTEKLNSRIADIESIYTTDNWDVLESLTKNYNVSYIFVGKLEREKFPDINHAMLRAMGEIAFEDGDTYIVKVK